MEEENTQPNNACNDDKLPMTETELKGDVTETQEVKKRSVKLTQKALWDKIESLQRDRKAKLNNLSKLKVTIVNLMGGKEYVNEVKCTFDKYQGLCDEAKQMHETLLGLLPSDEATKHDVWFKAKMLNVTDFIVKVKQWLVNVQSCLDDDDKDEMGDRVEKNTGAEDEPGVDDKEETVAPHDSISNVESRRSSKGSSHKSSKGSYSSTSSARIKAQADQAALLARAAALKGKHALEEEEFLLRRKKEQLELDTEIAASTARLAVLQAVDGSVATVGKSDGMESYFRKIVRLKDTATPFTHEPLDDRSSQQHISLHAVQNNTHPIMEKFSQQHISHHAMQSDTHPKMEKSVASDRHIFKDECAGNANQMSGDIHSLLQQQNDITALLVKTQISQLLPHREIPVFKGDPLQFNTFMKAFEHCVEAKTIEKGDCLYYLEQFTAGQPKDLVRSCLHMPSEIGYTVAKRLLKEHFGSGIKITAAYMEKFIGWPSVKSEDVKGLQASAFYLRECANAMEDLLYLEELNMPSNMKILIQKLPYKLREKWRVKACNILDTENRRACFTDIVKFIEQQVRIVSDLVFGDIQDNTLGKTGIKNKPQLKPQLKRNSFATHVSVTDELKADASKSAFTSMAKTNVISCLYCACGHALELCPQLGKKAHREKLDFLKEKGLCFGCLCTGHLSRNCDRRITCKKCNQTHPSILHVERKEKGTQETSDTQRKGSENCTTTSTCGHTGAGYNNGILPILPVQVKCIKGNKVMKTYAFLDPGSTGTFCSGKLAKELQAEGRKAKIHLRTMGLNKAVSSSIINGLEISGLSGKHFYELPEVFTQNEMPVSPDNIISEEELSQWPYLKDIQIPHIKADVDLLIGTNASKLMEPWEVINSRSDGPYAIKTLLGWVINGPLQGNNSHNGNGYPAFTVNRTQIDRIEELLTNQYHHDFNEATSDDQEEMSWEEKRFMEIVESSAQLKEGHYVLKLPFKKENVIMPNNLCVAKQRIHGLKRKFQKNARFHEEYTVFLSNVINKGYAEQVPQHRLEPCEGKVWYIPHHGVHHPKKGTLRVVFDCGAEFKGVSLNSQLLQGPNLTSTLVGVLMRFREEPVALMADIQAMFHQVNVAEEHVDFLRFLWWPEGNLEQDLVEHRMKVHLFGATSSPSCACFALRKTAEDSRTIFPKEVIDTVSRNFYMDDLLKSLLTEEDAINMVNNLRAICNRGGFNLTKWISNSRKVLQNIPEEHKAKNLYELDLDRDKLPVERALGLQWCIETDSFKFKLKVKEQPYTKRGLLSVISSVYDPLGFLAPVILPAKLLLQELCRSKCGWDDLIPQSFQLKWKKWLTDLEKVENFEVNRCIKPKDFGKITNAQLHHFSDASESGYGTVTYLRIQNSERLVHVAFLFSKARVAPLKPITIPRLELTAAVVAARVDKRLQSELQLPLKESTFWTDSTSVLKYIKNEDKRFQTFVANRVTTIRDSSNVSQWKYVPTSQNPADDASRGLKAENLANQRWIEGPGFLWEPEERWPTCPVDITLPADDPEVKQKFMVNATVVDSVNATHHLITYFSDWQRLRVTVAWFIKLKDILLKLSKQRKQLELANATANGAASLEVHKEMQAIRASFGNQRVTQDDLSGAETAIISFCQQEVFHQEIAALRNNLEVKKGSSIRRLDPILEGGLLRVGGRLNRAAMPEDIKHPLILSKDTHVSNLILRHFHERLGHGGRNHVLSSVRKKYWITNANSAVRKIIGRCKFCRRYRGKTGEQKMADLPIERVVPDLPPFTNVGVDYFGPIDVKKRTQHCEAVWSDLHLHGKQSRSLGGSLLS